MKIEKNKKYMTRIGSLIEVYRTDAGGEYPIIGAYEAEDRWVACAWAADGSASIGQVRSLDIAYPVA